MTLVYVAAIAALITGLFLGIRYFVRAYLRYRDSRIITCPDNGESAMVEVDALHAALTSVLGQPDVRLQNCARWPIQQSCGQECLIQLDMAEDCLIRGVMMRWYRAKSCVYCGKLFEQIEVFDHKPALLSPEGQILGWSDLVGKDLLSSLANLKPVCWDCYITRSFVQEHPDLVTYRPWR